MEIEKPSTSPPDDAPVVQAPAARGVPTASADRLAERAARAPRSPESVKDLKQRLENWNISHRDFLAAAEARRKAVPSKKAVATS